METINLEPTLEGYHNIYKLLKTIENPTFDTLESIAELEIYLKSKGVKL